MDSEGLVILVPSTLALPGRPRGRGDREVPPPGPAELRTHPPQASGSSALQNRPPAVATMLCRGDQGRRRACGAVNLGMHAGVSGGNRIRMMRSQTMADLDNCQLFSSRYKLKSCTAHAKL